MKARTEQAARWMYQGLWSILVRWFKVPAEAPTLPAGPGEPMRSFQPDEGFLRYMKFWFWLKLLTLDVLATIGTVIAVIALFVAGLWWLAGPVLFTGLFIILAPDVLVFLAIHLRYDTTWYVMTDRSLRIRRGIWVIHEVTITFENVQNISVRQGPVQRHFGIADVVVQTAGGGSAQPGHAATGHLGIVEGIANANEIRDHILARLKGSKSAGLGDEEADDRHAAETPGRLAWTRAHVDLLREIRDEARLLAAPR